LNVQKTSNRSLWDEWKDSLESAALGDGYAKKREEQCMNEIIRRMQEASTRPIVRQEA